MNTASTAPLPEVEQADTPRDDQTVVRRVNELLSAANLLCVDAVLKDDSRVTLRGKVGAFTTKSRAIEVARSVMRDKKGLELDASEITVQ